MDLTDYVAALKRRWKIVTGVVLLAVCSAMAFNQLSTPLYASTAKMYISSKQVTTTEALQGTQLSAARITSFAAMIDTYELAVQVAEDVRRGYTPEQVRNSVAAEVVPETFIIAITSTLPFAEDAKKVAQAYADGLVGMIENLETTLPGEPQPIKANVYEAATESTTPVSPRPMRNYALAILVGLLVGVCAAITRELLDNTVRSSADLDKVTSIPLLGDVPMDPATRIRDFDDSLDLAAPSTEAYRVLRTNLQFFDIKDSEGRVLVITSSLAGEGKTTTAVNLAMAHAQVGQSVLLIEADLRRPRASQALGLDQDIGLTTVLIGKASLADALQVHANGALHVLSSGALPPNPAELLQSRAMTELIDVVRAQFDFVVIDAPPLLPVTDAAILASHADGAILVVRYARTRKDEVATSASRLAQVDARAIGYLMNMVPANRFGYGYGYGYGPAEVPQQRRRGLRDRLRGSALT